MITPETAPPGSIVAVRVGTIWHEGLISDRRDLDGLPMVINKSKRTRRVEEEPFRIFAPRWSRVRLIGYPSRLPSSLVLERARARIGEPWSLEQNCERFCRSVHDRRGRAGRSPTIELVGAVGGVVLSGLGRLLRT